MSEVFQRNLEALARRDASLAREMKNFAARVEGIGIERAFGRPVLVAQGRDGRIVHLEDPRDPAKVAKEWAASMEPDVRLVLLLGAGLGHATKPLLAKRCVEAIWWIEPLPVLFRMALEAVDLRRVFADGRVRFFVGTPPEEVARRLRTEHNHAPGGRSYLPMLPNYVFLIHPAVRSLAAEKERDFRAALDEVFQSSARNRRTIGAFADLWRTNILGNARHFVDSPPVASLFGRAAGVPAVLVGAGPSLDRNVEALVGMEDRALLVVVDTALRTVREAGVRPHLVFALDATEANTADFQGVDVGGARLAFIPTLDPEVPPLFERKYVGSYGHPLQHYFESALGAFGDLLVSGSVATAAFDLIRKMGASPIVFAGVDLALGKTGHTRGNLDNFVSGVTRFHSLEMAALGATDANTRREPKREVAGWGGGTVVTTERMDRWREWFEVEIARGGPKVVNATEGGARIEGTEELPLAAALARLPPGRSVEKVFAGTEDAKKVARRRKKLCAALEAVLAEGGDGPRTRACLDWERVVHGEEAYERARLEFLRAAEELLGALSA